VRLLGQPRVSPVLDGSSTLELGSVKLTGEQIASRYKPIVRQKSAWQDRPLRIQYEVFEEASEYTIRYHIVWLDETHPIRPLNLIYRPFRILYYGSTVDIERIQVSVDRNTGRISTVVFETEPSKGSSAFPSHARAELSRRGQGYALLIDNGQAVEASPTFKGDRVEILVSNWNHEFSISFSPLGTTAFDLPLGFLGDDEYVALRYATRMQANSDRFHKARTGILLMCWFILSPLVILLTRSPFSFDR